MSFQNLTTRSKIYLAIFPSIILMLTLVGAVVYSINSIVGTYRAVDHTHEVLRKAAGIIRSAVDMETGMRGYLLAGKEGFLAPYHAGEQRTFAGIVALRKMVGDNPKQVGRMDEVRNILETWQQQVTKPTINLRREIGDAKSMNDMARLVGKASGKHYFDRFRGQIAIFIDEEHKLLEMRRRRAGQPAGRNFENADHTINWVNHTLEVLAAANRLLSAAVDMETGMRGYLLAGKEEFLEPYDAGTLNFQAEISKLEAKVGDNPGQVKLLRQIRETIKSWQESVTEPAIELRREIGNGKTMDDMADLIGEARGKRYFDQFRDVMAAFEKEEHELAALRQTANLNTIEATYLMIGVFTVIALTIGGLSAWFIGGNIAGPLAITTQAIQRLASGNTSTRIKDTGRRDELGTLTMAFNSMADQLIDKEKRVEEENNVRRRAEAALRDSEMQTREHLSQLEKVLRTSTISVMAAALSHQINQPLGSIMNFGRGSLRRLESEMLSPDDLQHTFRQICNEADRAAKILRNIRDYIRGAETEETLEDVNSLVTKATNLLEPRLKELKVGLDLDLHEQPLPAAVVPIEIEQAIINLAQNGIEAIEDGGADRRKISVRTYLDEADFVHVSFADTGKGVSEDIMNTMFEPFRSTKPYGMGMGLAISRIIIEKHGGDLSLAASAPAGSTIEFTLPLTEGMAADA